MNRTNNTPDKLRLEHPQYTKTHANGNDGKGLSEEMVKDHFDTVFKRPDPIKHKRLLDELLEVFEPYDFQEHIYPQVKKLKEDLRKVESDPDEVKRIRKEIDGLKVSQKQIVVQAIENIVLTAQRKNWGLCKNSETDQIYLYNGAFWDIVNDSDFECFLGKAAEKMKVNQYTAKYYRFREEMLKQFKTAANLPTPETQTDKVLINLKNGTLHITPGKTELKPFNRNEFLTYQLPFNYDPSAKAPIFNGYLNRVLPDEGCQKVLSEYTGYVFIKNGYGNLKLEKALMLYGEGSNGKSVYFDIIKELLGEQNFTSFSLQELTDNTGNHRSKIHNKLLNYASEINGKLNTDYFKKMVSGEPVSAKILYKDTFEMKQYAKLMFNCNVLPKDVEHTEAFFRRFIIIPFTETISDDEKDYSLSNKIVSKELSGVLNWILDGLKRLLENGKFTKSKIIDDMIDQFKTESDSVKLFIQESGYKKSAMNFTPVKTLYTEYKEFCSENSNKFLKRLNFKKRLLSDKVTVERKNIGEVVYLTIGHEF